MTARFSRNEHTILNNPRFVRRWKNDCLNTNQSRCLRSTRKMVAISILLHLRGLGFKFRKNSSLYPIITFCPRYQMLPTSMKAVVSTGDGRCEVRDVDLPQPGPKEILVEVYAAAQNPTDWKTLLTNKVPGNIVGCDFSGVIVQLGAEVDIGVRRIGERVAGFIHGGISSNGTFAEYLVAPSEVIFSLPDTMSFEDAAQLGIACYTSCQCLYQTLQLPTPFQPAHEPTDVLIWSGTSSTGQIAIQLAKLSGLRVISTASAGRVDFVKALGADDVYDYADSKTPRKIRAANPTIRHAVDCISDGMTPNQVSASLSKEGGMIATLLPYESKSKGVSTKFVLAYSIFGKDITIPYTFAKNEEHVRNAVFYSRMISKLLAENRIKPVPVKLYPEGLSSVVEGLEFMKAGKVHAEKITYRIKST